MKVVIRDARPGANFAVARELLDEYGRWIGIDLGFQDFSRELDSLPGEYGPPRGVFLLAWCNNIAAGCVALRPLQDDRCEMKRLFVRERWKGEGLGRRLAEAIIDRARQLGYRAMRLDTLPNMTAAIALYRSLGFRESEPYRFNPVEGTLFFELDLVW